MLPPVSALYEATGVVLRNLLDERQLSPGFRASVDRALATDGKVCSPTPRSRWPLLVLLSCWGAGGDWRESVGVAAAAELVGLASDLLDELEDGDRCPLADELGVPRTQNLAFALLAAAGCVLARSPAASGPIWETLLAAADGQHADLGPTPFTTPDAYLALVDRKAAGLTSVLCAAGALAAGAGPDRVQGYAQFGLHLGRQAQLLNDLRDVLHGTAEGKADVSRRRLTLLHAFVLRGPEGVSRERVLAHLAGAGPVSPSEEQALQAALWESGALHYAWLRAEAERCAAESVLREISPTRAAALSELLLVSPSPPGPV